MLPAPHPTCLCVHTLQGDSTEYGVKDLDVVLGREEWVLILDDTEGVWPRHRDNLITVERYLYFPACAAKFGARCMSSGLGAGWLCFLFKGSVFL